MNGWLLNCTCVLIVLDVLFLLKTILFIVGNISGYIMNSDAFLEGYKIKNRTKILKIPR